MRDAAQLSGVTVTARLMRELDAGEARRRNALSTTRPGLSLNEGSVVTVVETFGTGEAFLVEFNAGKAKAGTCDWMGVLYPSEIEVLGSTSAR
jgi:hypothetical protein